MKWRYSYYNGNVKLLNTQTGEQTNINETNLEAVSLPSYILEGVEHLILQKPITTTKAKEFISLCEQGEELYLVTFYRDGEVYYQTTTYADSQQEAISSIIMEDEMQDDELEYLGLYDIKHMEAVIL